MNYKEKIKETMALIVFIITVLGLPFTSKVAFEETIARELLRYAYQPVISFVMDLEETDDPLKLKLPDYIQSKDDFLTIVGSRMNQRVISKLYGEMVYEEEGTLYADSTIYIPTIYDKDRGIKKAYISIKQPLFNKFIMNNDINITRELIIKTSSMTPNGSHSSSKYEFKENDQDEWFLDSKTGSVMSDFVDAGDNLWNEMRQAGFRSEE